MTTIDRTVNEEAIEEPETAAEGSDLANELAAQLASGATVNVPFGEDDVGSELLAVLSEGLYNDPRDALREYVQNSVDAHSPDAWIELSGRTITVRDVGCGMDLNALLEARRIAKSPKAGSRSIGFRGIGIYAALSLCERLHIDTQTAHSDVRYTMTFEFGEMIRLLEAYRSEPVGEQISLAAMLRACTTICETDVDPLDHGETVITLEDVKADKYREIQNITSLEDYLVKALPVAFDPAFAHSAALNKQLSSVVHTYRTINVHLSDPLQGIEKEIYRRFPEGVGAPQLLHAESADRVEAVIWVCYGENNERVANGGLVFKMHGFTVGDREAPRALFKKKPQTYEWIFGEIYIVNDDVRPNAARNDFEKSAAWRRCEEALKPKLGSIGDEMARRWAIIRARHVFDRIAPEIRQLRNAIRSDTKREFVPYHFAHVERLREQIKKQRLSRSHEFDTLRRRARRLMTILEVSAKRLPVLHPSKLDRSAKGEPSKHRRGSSPSNIEMDKDGHGKDLVALFAAAGVKLSASQQRVTSIIQRALDEAFAPGSVERNQFENSLGRHLQAVR